MELLGRDAGAGRLRAVFLMATALKLLLIPSYRSTDFEVHRNWLAITHTLPLSNWYYESTSEWTLDYPPLFAWFEWALAHAAVWFDPAMVELHNLNYASPLAVLFQRLTVIAADLVLFAGALRLCRTLFPLSEAKQLACVGLVALNPGLLIVDHVHFQYNGLLMGLLLLSIDAILRSHVLVGAALFTVVMNMKHIFVYMAPVYFVYILKNYCFCAPSAPSTAPSTAPATAPSTAPSAPLSPDRRRRPSLAGSDTESDTEGSCAEEEGDEWYGGAGAGGEKPRSFSPLRFIRVGLVVIAVVAVSLGPFVYLSQIRQVLSRLFPFGRGLCNAYWAPNFWTLYNVADKILAQLLRRFGVGNVGVGVMTGGLVGEFEHAVLPVVKPLHTFVLTLAASTPLLWKLLDGGRGGRVFIAALVQCSLCFFMFSWHVHEKAVLMPILLLTLLAGMDRCYAHAFFFASTVAHYSLFPLLFTPREYATKMLLVGTYALVAWVLLPQIHAPPPPPPERRRSGSGTEPAAAAGERLVGGWWTGGGAYLAGLAAVEAYGSWGVHAWLWGAGRLPFLPLLVTSLYCALGLLHAFVRLYRTFLLLIAPSSPSSTRSSPAPLKRS